MALLSIAKLTLNLSLRSLSSGFFAGAVHTAPRLACRRITSGELGGLFFGFFALLSNECGDHPQIVGQYAPGNGEVAVSKSFASQRTSKKVLFQDPDAPLRLCPAPLRGLEFPRPFSLLELSGIPGANRIIHPLVAELFLVALAVKSPIGPEQVQLHSQVDLGSFQTPDQQPRIGGSRLSKQFPVHDQSLGTFS